MNRIAKLTLFKNTPAFNKRTLQRILDIKDEALNANVKRWLKKGELIQLKRGWYVTKDYYQLSSNKQNYFS